MSEWNRLVVDGTAYNVNIKDIGLDVEFMYKYAQRTEDYCLNYELGAVFYNQSLTFGVESSPDAEQANWNDYQKLIAVLKTKSTIDSGTGHNVELWTPFGKMTFLMYPNGIKMKMSKVRDSGTWWSSTTIKFIAVKPVESW